MFDRLRYKFAQYLLIKIKRATKDRAPDVTVGDNYLRRWHIIPENKYFNIYYHEIRASDLDRHLHDHPYFFSSFILEGGYYEHTEDDIISRKPGDLNIHSPWFFHRLEMRDESGANTIFITAPKIKIWGFKTEDGWVANQEYLEKHGIQGALQNPITVDKTEDERERKAS